MTQEAPPFAKRDDLSVVFHPNPCGPLGRQVQGAAWEAGKTIREYLVQAGLDPHTEIVIRLNNRMLTVEEWDTVCPDPNSLLNVEAVAAGGDGGGSNPIAIVLSIAIMIYAPYLASTLYSSMGGTFVAANAGMIVGAMTIGVSIVGSMLIGAIFKPSLPNQTNANASAAQESPTYSLSGGSNSVRPYEPVPVLLGTHRVFPDYASKPYAEFQGEDQYLYQVFNFGIGDYALTDIRIGETLLSDYSDVVVTRAVGNSLPGFYRNVDTVSGASLANVSGSDPETNWVVRTSANATVKLGVDIEGTYYYANDAGGFDSRSADIQVEYRLTGSATWLPFQPDEYAPVISNYWSKGYWFDTSVPEQYVDMGDGLGSYYTPAAPGPTVWRQTGYDTDLSATAHVENDSAGTYTVPAQGWRQSTTTPLIWRWVAVGTDPHPVHPYSGSSNQITMSGSSQKPVRKSLSKQVPSGQYDVRVRRVTADETLNRAQSTTAWTSLRSYQEGAADFTDLTVIGVKIKASGQLNGAIQRLSALAVNKTDRWDGSGWVHDSNINPAWWYMHFAMGYRDAAGRLLYGCGLSASQININEIKAWATFCDTNGLHFSRSLDRQVSAYDSLSMIARCGFASPSWSSGKLGVVWDAPNQAPVMAFGMSNICAGSFEVSYVTDSLPDEIVVRYTNRDNLWAQDEVRVTVPGTVGTPARTVSLELEGCTTNAMAAKFANATAASQYYRRRHMTWETDVEGFVCQRGDVVILQHDLTQWGYSGRIISVDGATITLSRTVPRNGAMEHLMIQAPDGTCTYYNVPAGSGESDTLTLIAPAVLQDGYAPVDHQWFFSPLATPGKKVKVTGIQPISEYRVRIVATDEDPGYYAAWGGSFTSPTGSTLLSKKAAVIDRVTFSESLILNGSGYAVQLSATLSPSGDYAAAKVRTLVDGTLYDEQVISGTIVTVQVPATGTVSMHFVPVNGLGQPGAGVTATHTIAGKALPPSDVISFTYVTDNSGLTLKWAHIPDPDRKEYEIRVGATWATGAVVANVAGTELRLPTAVAGTYHYMISAIDTSGNYSVTASSIDVVLTSPTTVSATASISGTDFVVAWSTPSSMFLIDYYELRYGATYAGSTLIGKTYGTIYQAPVLWAGDRTIWVAAYDAAGNSSTPYPVTLHITSPLQPTLRAEVIDNNVLLYWTDATASLPINEYEIRRGATYATATVVGTKQGQFTSLFETSSGTYTYWVTGIDSAGNYGTPSAFSTVVSQPPDYVLKASIDSTLSGTLSNAVKDARVGGVVMPLNTTETFAQHFTSRGWTSPSSQIGAGYPIYAQPGNLTGYYEETVDYGTILASCKVTVTPTTSVVSGSPVMSTNISLSANGSTWIDYTGQTQVYGVNFRYVKVRVAVSGDDHALISLTALNIKLDAKLKTITGTTACVAGDVGGTTIYVTDTGNSSGSPIFIDVDAIQVTVQGTTPITPMYDFVDAPNPTSFKVLLFNQAGARVSGTVSWTVRGF